MSYITTFTGKHFDPIDSIKEDIDIKDIAHSLSLICRANGHVKYFYSVAQHSIACCQEAKARGYSRRIQLACLLHDASEAYLSDVTRPIKGRLTEYLEVEEALQNTIWNQYLECPLTKEEEKQVFEIDDDMLSYEFHLLMPETISDRYQYVISQPNLEFKNPRDVESELIELVNMLLS